MDLQILHLAQSASAPFDCLVHKALQLRTMALRMTRNRCHAYKALQRCARVCAVIGSFVLQLPHAFFCLHVMASAPPDEICTVGAV
jgi:hypothetical protein